MFWLTVLFEVAICSIDEQHVSMRPQDSLTNLSKFVDPSKTFQPSPLNAFQHTTQDALLYEANYSSLEPNPNPPYYECQDVPPSGYLSCQDYVKRGWCYLIPQYCVKSCWDCCIDSPINFYVPCQQLKFSGYCEEAVEQGYCWQTCGRCEDGAERFALLELKNSIQFPNQLSTWTGWDVCSSWAGVTCTINRVTTISLGDWVYNFQEQNSCELYNIVSDAQTSIPKSFSLLSQLTELWLDTSGFSGTIPVELSVLTNLEAFAFASSAMSGVFPPEFSAWKKMKYIDMCYNQMVGRIPTQYSEWKEIVALGIGNNSFTGVLPPQFSAWKKIQGMDISGNQMVGTIPAQFSEWKDLEEFDISDNGFTGTLPEEYSTWRQNLQAWQSYNNDLTGSIPVQYSTFISLGDDNFCDGTQLCAPSTLENSWITGICPSC